MYLVLDCAMTAEDYELTKVVGVFTTLHIADLWAASLAISRALYLHRLHRETNNSLVDYLCSQAGNFGISSINTDTLLMQTDNYL